MTDYSDPAYNETDNALRTGEIDPVSQHYVGPEHIIEESNETDDGTKYYQSFSMLGYNRLTIEYDLTAINLKIFIVNNPDAVDTVGTDWYDTTNAWGGAATLTGSGLFSVVVGDDDVGVRVLLERDPTNATNATDVFIHRSY